MAETFRWEVFFIVIVMLMEPILFFADLMKKEI